MKQRWFDTELWIALLAFYSLLPFGYALFISKKNTTDKSTQDNKKSFPSYFFPGSLKTTKIPQSIRPFAFAPRPANFEIWNTPSVAASYSLLQRDRYKTCWQGPKVYPVVFSHGPVENYPNKWNEINGPLEGSHFPPLRWFMTGRVQMCFFSGKEFWWRFWCMYRLTNR